MVILALSQHQAGGFATACYHEGILHLQVLSLEELNDLLPQAQLILHLGEGLPHSEAPVLQLRPVPAERLKPAAWQLLGDRIDELSAQLLQCGVALARHCMEEGLPVVMEGVVGPGQSHRVTLTKQTVSYLQISCQDLHPSLIKGKGRSKQGYSLLSLFEGKCFSRGGRALLRSWFALPLRSADQITRRQKSVKYLKRFFIPKQKLIQKLYRAAGDVAHAAARIARGQPGLLTVIRRQAQASLQLVDLVRGQGIQNLPQLLRPFIGLNPSSSKIQELVITLGNCLQEKQEKVRQGVNLELDSLRRLYVQLQDVLKLHEGREASRLQTQLGISYLPQLGYFIVLARQADPSLNLAFNFSTPDGYFYKNETVTQLDQDYGDVLSRIADLQACVFRQLGGMAASLQPQFMKVGQALSQLDGLLGLARAGLSMTTPTLSSAGDFVVEGGWCPLLNRDAIPNNCFVHTFDSRWKVDSPSTCLVHPPHSNRAVLLTGANASGKSVYGRQLGIIAFLALIGSNVPATRAVVPLFDGIYCLDGQDSIARGMTVSASQVSQLSRIVQTAGRDSLVILDELGHSLPHSQGLSLCYAAVKQLTDPSRKGGVPVSLHLTHFTQLITQDLVREDAILRFLRMATIEQSGSVLNCYDLQTGYVTDSHSFMIAQALDVDKGLLAAARKYFKRIVKGQSIR